MNNDIVSSSNVGKCCDCGFSCSLTNNSSYGDWIRSVKRKYNEFEQSDRFHVPGVEVMTVVRVGIENECALLRETVSSQLATIQELCLELDEERNASSSAANEAMSMILRLQSEKAEIQMEARQFKRFAEEKMAHDVQEINALEEVLYKREQVMQSLTCEVQAYKHRMLSFGLTESEAEGLKGTYSHNASFCSDMNIPVDYPYPQLRCNLNGSQGQSEQEDDDVGVEKFPFEEIPRSQDLRNFELRINHLERIPHGDHTNAAFGSGNVLEKVTVGNSPRQVRHSRKHSTESAGSLLGFGRDIDTDYSVDYPKLGTTTIKKLDCVTEELKKSDIASDYDDGMCDRVCTIDSVHPGEPYNHYSEPKFTVKPCDEYGFTSRGSLNPVDSGDPDVKKLYMRLQNLEADRESMRQAIISMQTDKAQLVLLREIAQQLYKDRTPARPMALKKSSNIRSFSFLAALKWILSLFFWRKKARRSKYIFEMRENNLGLLLLLDKNPRKLWRCVSSAQP